MSWTDERIELLKKLWDQGLSASQIADQLAMGVTRNAVIGKAHRLGLKSRPSPVKTEASAPAKAAKEAAATAAPAAPSAAPAPAAPKKAKVPAKPQRVTLLDLSDKICKWPIGHPGDEDFHFCGKPVNPGTPYCAEHCAQAYQAQLPRRDRRPPLPLPGARVRV
jgi:GcrA cell cycle regulator